MTKRAVSFLACLLLLVGTASISSAAEQRGPTVDLPSPTEGIAQWMSEWIDQVRTTWASLVDADAHDQVYRSDSSGPGEQPATGAHGQNPSGNSIPSDGDDGLLETGPLIEPLG